MSSNPSSLKLALRFFSVGLLLSCSVSCSVTPPQKVNEKYRKILESRLDRYHIQPGDELIIKVYQSQAEELSPQQFTVQPDGRADLYFMPNYRFAGKTVTEVEEDVRRNFRDETGTDMPELSILCSPMGESVILNGEFSEPGKLEYRHGMTLNDAIAEVGRFRVTADSDYALLRRSHFPNPPGSPEMFRIDLNDDSEEIFLLPGDEVLLGRNAVATVILYFREYIFGIFPSSLYSFALGSVV